MLHIRLARNVAVSTESVAEGLPIVAVETPFGVGEEALGRIVHSNTRRLTVDAVVQYQPVRALMARRRRFVQTVRVVHTDVVDDVELFSTALTGNPI